MLSQKCNIKQSTRVDPTLASCATVLIGTKAMSCFCKVSTLYSRVTPLALRGDTFNSSLQARSTHQYAYFSLPPLSEIGLVCLSFPNGDIRKKIFLYLLFYLPLSLPLSLSPSSSAFYFPFSQATRAISSNTPQRAVPNETR